MNGTDTEHHDLPLFITTAYPSVLIALGPQFVELFSISSSGFGWLVTVGVVSTCVTIPVWTWISRRFSPALAINYAIYGSFAGMGIIALAVYLAGRSPLVLALLILGRILQAASTPAILYLSQHIATLTPHRALARLGHIGTIAGCGRLAGAGLAIFAATRPVFLLVLWPILLIFIKTNPSRDPVPPYTHPVKRRLLIPFIVQIATGILYVTATPIARALTQNTGAATALTATVLLCAGLGAVSAQLILKMCGDRLPDPRLSGCGTIMAGYILILCTHSPSFFIIGAGLAGAGTAMTLTANLARSGGAPAAFAVQTAGMAIGTMTATVFVDTGTAPPLIIAISLLAALLAGLVLLPQPNRSAL